jgi:RNA ligase (TIGR02306 family)
MSTFACPVVRIKIEPHPNADAIEIARVGDYQSIVKKGQFSDGDLAVYIPEQAVLPQWLLEELGFWNETTQKGGLSGSMGNRVRAIKLRQVLSQGLVVSLAIAEIRIGNPLRQLDEGEDVASYLEVVKYEPPIPSHMAGRIAGVDLAATLNYDFENLKKVPDLFEDGELVLVTEKIHGTFMQVGVVPSEMANERYYKGRVIVSSKGMGAKGYILDHTDETNLYVQTAKKYGLLDSALEYFGDAADDVGKPYFVCGEVFGKTATGAGVQDLIYNGETLGFRMFDVCCGTRGQQEFFDYESFLDAAEALKVPNVPILELGPYSKEMVLRHTNGNTMVQPEVTRNYVNQIREGVVVKSAHETPHPKYGRKIAKSVSEAYLLRKNATEFN